MTIKRTLLGIAMIAALSSMVVGWSQAQQTGEQSAGPAARGRGRGVVPPPPPPPQLLFRMTLKKNSATPEPLTQDSVTSPNLEVQFYGDAKSASLLANTPGGGSQYDPHTFNGNCNRPCGMTFRDKANYFDLTGNAKIKWVALVSGFHRVRPLVKLADGTLLIGDQANGSVADWQGSEVSFSEVRWLKLDPDRGVTTGVWVPNPDLSKVDEVGYFDVIPGSGRGAGGWVSLAGFELWGKPVSR